MSVIKARKYFTVTGVLENGFQVSIEDKETLDYYTKSGVLKSDIQGISFASKLKDNRIYMWQQKAHRLTFLF